MGINETQYRINIEGFQYVLGMIRSGPDARLVIEPHQTTLIISGEYAQTVQSPQEIARTLERTAERFYESDNDEPIIVRNESIESERQFVVVVQSDGVCDYIPDAASGHQVDQSVVEAVVADYRLNDCYTLVFSLDGSHPYILPNSEKGKHETTGD